jgi:hypothetical protein
MSQGPANRALPGSGSGSAPSSLHVLARVATIGGLVAGALAIGAVIAFTYFVRVKGKGPPGGVLGKGIRLVAYNADYAVGAVAMGAVAAFAIVLAVLAWRRLRWSYLAAGSGALLAIAAAWLVRWYVWSFEARTGSAGWADASPYVFVVTVLAIAATIFLGVLAASGIAAFVTAPRTARPARLAPSAGPSPPAEDAGSAR